MSSSSRFRLTPAAGAIFLLAHACANAQTATAPAAPASAATSGTDVHSLTTVVISGPRATGFTSAVVGIGAFRDQAPVDVPLTNSVVTREVLNAQGAHSVMDAVRNTAGVTRSQTGAATYDNLAIRGVTMENRSSYRLDGSLPIIGLVPVPIEDKERVEVLKGASSMYYGMVPPAGIVSFEMKRAGPKPVTSFSTSINQYGGYDVDADVGRRFGDGDRFGLRVNLLDGKDEPGLHNYRGHRKLEAAAFDFRVLDNLTFRADLEHYQHRSTETPLINLIGTATALPQLPDNRLNQGPEWAQNNSQATNALARVDWGVTENWNVTVEYGLVHAGRDRQAPSFTFNQPTSDSPTSPAAYSTGAGTILGTFLPGQKYSNSNARFDLSGRLETGPVAHEITVGFTRNARFQDTNNGKPTFTYGPFPQNFYGQSTIPVQTAAGVSSSSTSLIIDRGLYAVDRIIVTKQLHVMLGLRHTNYWSNNIFPAPTTAAYTTSVNSPNISVIFKPTPNNSVYFSRLRGLEAGAGVGQTFLNSQALLPAADTTQTEIGYKHQLGGMLLQASAFNIDRAQTTSVPTTLCGTQAQISAAAPGVIGVSVPNPAGGPNILCALNQTQDGKARYRGLEMAASGELNRNIGVVASALFMNPKITKDSSPGSTNTQGHEPGNAAKQTFSLFGEYRFDSLPGLGINAGAYYTGRRPAGVSNNVYLPSNTLFSLGARYRTKINTTAATFQLNVDNAGDRKYWAAADATSANPIIAEGLPRMIRATATFDF